jgi:DNA-binding NtrC family response regulator
MMRENILVIDEEAKLHSLFEKIAALHSCKVLEAVDGKMAEKIVAHEQIDVIVCEMRLLPSVAHAVEKALLQKRVEQLEGLLVEQEAGELDLESVEKRHIQRVLNYTKGNKVEAARLLNIGLTTVYRKIEEYGL